MKELSLTTRVARLESRVTYLLANLGVLQLFVVGAVRDDYLDCFSVGTGGVINEEVIRQVAKPYLLRRTPFDGKTRAGVIFTYTSDVTRTASDGTDTEEQVVVPAYVVGDIILVRRVNPNSNVTYEGDAGDEDTLLPFIDMNNDARVWAKAAE